MKHKNKHINTFIVQYVETLLIGSILLVQAYPAPALAFVNKIQTPARFENGEMIPVTASAYSSTVEQTDASPFITASGSTVRHGIVAANFLPLHTKIRIGSEVYTVEDRMNERYNNTHRIDIWMPSQEAAVAFGTRTLVIEIEHTDKE